MENNKFSAPVNFDAIDDAIMEFIQTTNKKPTLIVMHPVDNEAFIRLIRDKYNLSINQNQINYHGIRLIRSFDVEQGRFLVC